MYILMISLQFCN